MLTGMFLLASCAGGDELDVSVPDAEQQPMQYVFQERDAALPTVPYRKGTIGRRAVAGFPALSDYLGCAYRDITSIMGDPENFTYPVIDLNRLRADHPDYFSSRPLLRNDTYYYAYTSDESFEENSLIREKFSKGFELDLWLFKIGRKKTMERIFARQYLQQSRDALGELTIEVQHALYSLLQTSLVNQRIAGEYLRPDFVEILYNSTMDEVVDAYGAFVATGYYTGGRASALYYGQNHSASLSVLRQEGLTKDIEASFSWDKFSGGGNLSFGNTSGSSSTHKSEFQHVWMAVNTIGGTKDTGVNLGARNLDEIRIDMSKWLASLDNTANHTVIGIQNEGLRPLSDYLLEKNFKLRVERAIEGTPSQQMQIPYIAIELVTNSMKRDYIAVLYTRHGDRILLGRLFYRIDSVVKTGEGAQIALNQAGNEGFILNPYDPAKQLAEQKAKFYKLRIEKVNSFCTAAPTVDLGDVNELYMKKFVNKQNGMIYLFDDQLRIAYCFPDDDYTVDVYGIRDWVERMQSGTVSMTLLERDYTLVGL